MAYLNSFKSVVTKSELDIFSQKATQTAIESSYFAEIRPLSVFDAQAPIEFFVNESSDYIDLNHTQLKLKLKICHDDGSNLKSGDTVVPCNNFCNSLFDHISLELNGKCVTTPGNSYPYRSYFESLLNFGSESKKGHLTAGLFTPDEPGKFDDLTSEGFVKRKRFLHNGVVELSSYLHLDIMSQEKCLLNGISLRFKFYRSKPDFSLMATSEDTQSYRIDILDACLLIRKLKVNPSVMIAHERTLARNNSKMPINRIEIKKITIAKDTQTKTFDNVFIGESLMIIITQCCEINVIFLSFRSSPKKNLLWFCCIRRSKRFNIKKPLQLSSL